MKIINGKNRTHILYFTIFMSVLTIFFYWILNNPDIYLLSPDSNASWIRLPEPYTLHIRKGSELQAVFYKKINLDRVINKSIFELRAFKSPSVFINGKQILSYDNISDNWKKFKHYDLTSALKKGENEILILVKNRNSHPAVSAYSKQLNIRTDSTWYVSRDCVNWIHAQNVTDPVIVVLSSEMAKIFTPTKDAFFAISPFLIIIFAFAFSLTLLANRRNEIIDRYCTASTIRFVILISYLLLAINNFFKIPVLMGFDVRSHIDYIRYVSDNMSLPLANQGWQFFQAPLFYIVSSFVFKAGMSLYNYDLTIRLLHIIPLICGLIQIEVGYQTMKIVFNERKYLQIFGTLICGIMPMNIYMSQTIGNEHLAGVLTAMVLYFCIKQHYVSNRNFSIAIGIFMGLALLAKVTAVLLIPIVMINFIMVKNVSFKHFKLWMRPFFTSLIIAFFISGWFYIRNYSHFGHFMIGGWDPFWISWWQDPGFRLTNHFANFGRSIVSPAFSYVEGFWDALYSSLWLDGYLLARIAPPLFPPWNYKWMLSCAWLALPATLALMFSFCKSFNNISRPVLVLSRSVLLLYLSAMLYMYLTLPIYSAAKATYTLGLLPIYGILITIGISPIMEYKLSRSAVFGWLACFSTCVYISYFIIDVVKI